jgi:hypothetical protein
MNSNQQQYACNWSLCLTRRQPVAAHACCLVIFLATHLMLCQKHFEAWTKKLRQQGRFEDSARLQSLVKAKREQIQSMLAVSVATAMFNNAQANGDINNLVMAQEMEQYYRGVREDQQLVAIEEEARQMYPQADLVGTLLGAPQPTLNAGIGGAFSFAMPPTPQAQPITIGETGAPIQPPPTVARSQQQFIGYTAPQNQLVPFGSTLGFEAEEDESDGPVSKFARMALD